MIADRNVFVAARTLATLTSAPWLPPHRIPGSQVGARRARREASRMPFARMQACGSNATSPAKSRRRSHASQATSPSAACSSATAAGAWSALRWWIGRRPHRPVETEKPVSPTSASADGVRLASLACRATRSVSSVAARSPIKRAPDDSSVTGNARNDGVGGSSPPSASGTLRPCSRSAPLPLRSLRRDAGRARASVRPADRRRGRSSSTGSAG